MSEPGNHVRVTQCDYFRPIGAEGIVLRKRGDLRAVQFTGISAETRVIREGWSADWQRTLLNPEIWINDTHLKVID